MSEFLRRLVSFQRGMQAGSRNQTGKNTDGKELLKVIIFLIPMSLSILSFEYARTVLHDTKTFVFAGIGMLLFVFAIFLCVKFWKIKPETHSENNTESGIDVGRSGRPADRGTDVSWEKLAKKDGVYGKRW